jgi:lysophospholipase L1-like esterase
MQNQLFETVLVLETILTNLVSEKIMKMYSNHDCALKRYSRILTFLFILSILFTHSLSAQGYDTLYLKNKTYQHLMGMYALYETKHADVVMFGNSITFGANWAELMSRSGIVNRGIGGDNTYGYLSRLNQVYALHPKLCCIMGGINDMYAGIPTDSVFTNYCKILDTLCAHHIVPVIQSTLYVAAKYKNAVERNTQVTRLNMLLKEYAANNNIRFLDLNKLLSTGELLQDEMTGDGVHLTAPAYHIWKDALEIVLREYGL